MISWLFLYFTILGQKRVRTIVLFRDVPTDCSKKESIILKSIIVKKKKSPKSYYLCMLHMNIVVVGFRNKQWLHIKSLKQWNTDERRQSCDRCVSGVTIRVSLLWLIQRNLFVNCYCFRNLCQLACLEMTLNSPVKLPKRMFISVNQIWSFS